MNLAQGVLAPEPVERSPHHDGFGARLRQWNGLRRAGHRMGLRHGGDEAFEHRGYRFHGDHKGAGGLEQPGQLAGARGEVHHGAAGPEAELGDEQIDGDRAGG